MLHETQGGLVLDFVRQGSKKLLMILMAPAAELLHVQTCAKWRQN